MKARLIREDLEIGNTVQNPDSVHLVEKVRNHEVILVACWKAGAIMDHPNAFRYVQMGVCEAVDDECIKRANMTPKKMAAAVFAYERTNRGIHPDDFRKYNDGELVGYNADGSDIPGPNAVPEDEDEDDEDINDE